MSILPLPKRETFEEELRDEIFDRGDQKNLAGYLRIDKARISRQLDPHNSNCPSPSFQFLEWLWAIDAEGDFERSDKMIEQIVREVNKWRVRPARQRKESQRELTANIFDAATDFLKTESADTDIDTQLNKLDLLRKSVENKADRLKIEKAEKLNMN